MPPISRHRSVRPAARAPAAVRRGGALRRGAVRSPAIREVCLTGRSRNAAAPPNISIVCVTRIVCQLRNRMLNETPAVPAAARGDRAALPVIIDTVTPLSLSDSMTL